MKTTSLVLTCISIAAALLIVSATDASAKTKRLGNMSPSDLHTSCGNAGGAYGTAAECAGICMGGTGNYVICDKNKHCTAYVAMVAAPPSKGEAASTPFELQGQGRHDLSAASATTSVEPSVGIKSQVLGAAMATEKFAN